MNIIVIKMYGIEVAAFTWTRDVISGISYAKAICKEKGYMNPKIFVV